MNNLTPQMLMKLQVIDICFLVMQDQTLRLLYYKALLTVILNPHEEIVESGGVSEEAS